MQISISLDADELLPGETLEGVLAVTLQDAVTVARRSIVGLNLEVVGKAVVNASKIDAEALKRLLESSNGGLFTLICPCVFL